MSTDYGIKCLDCNDEYITEYLGEYMISDVIEQSSSIKTFFDSYKNVGVSIDVTAYWCPNGLTDLFEFISKHADHKLVEINEYGDVILESTKSRWAN